jgi:phosphatidylglycerol---prolipoprotein diacylglyceryl transferase
MNFESSTRSNSFRSDSTSSYPLWFNPKKIGAFFGLIFICISAISAFPLSLIFSGKFVLRSDVRFLSLNDIKSWFNGWEKNQTLYNIFEFMTQNSLEWFGFRYYSLCLFFGAVIAFFLLLYFFSARNIGETTTEKFFVIMVILGMIGARGLFILTNLEYYIAKPNEILHLQGGGFSVFGAFVVCGVYLFYYCYRFKFNLSQLLSLLTPSIIILQIFTRIGNFFNYESYGKPTSLPWRMYVPEGAVNVNRYNINSLERYYHPVFLYEVVINAGLLFIILFYFKSLERYKTGMVFAVFAIVYSITRFLLDYLRLDATTINGLPVTLAQVFSLLLLCFGVFLIIKKKSLT